MNESLPLPLGALGFYFTPPEGWPSEPVAVAFRLRGLLGKEIRRRHCMFDPERTPCRGCELRADCLYGNGFEAPENVNLPGFGRAGAAPHAWSLQVERAGQRWRGCLWLSGLEAERAATWRDAVAAMPVAPAWFRPGPLEEETLTWRSLTPVRLRAGGGNAGRDDVARALAASVARKARMLAAMHGARAPEARLETGDVNVHEWVDVERYSFRHRRVERLGGWMLDVRWPETSADWRPWLALIRALGAGRQTSFGLGRFACLDGWPDG